MAGFPSRNATVKGMGIREHPRHAPLLKAHVDQNIMTWLYLPHISLGQITIKGVASISMKSMFLTRLVSHRERSLFKFDAEP